MEGRRGGESVKRMAQILSYVNARMGRVLTDVVHGVFLRHVLRYTGHYIDGVVFGEEAPSELGVVTDEDAGVKLAFV